MNNLKKKKQGFTIVELVVVIAIIGILSAIIIPIFSGLINKANLSSDQALVKNLNTALAMDNVENGDYETVHETFESLKNNYGYDAATIVTKSNCELVYDSANNQFVLDLGNGEYFPEVSYKKNELYKLWKIYTDGNKIESEDQTYSIYLADNKYSNLVNVSVGLDVGTNTIIPSIIYTNGEKRQEVIIRTNSTKTDLTINAPADTVKHYGEVGNVTINEIDSENCYHEKGYFITAKIKSGKIVIGEGIKVGTITVPENATNNVIIENSGSISLLNTISAPVNVTTNNTGSINTVLTNSSNTITGNSAENKFNNITKLTSDTHTITSGGYYDGTGVTIKSLGTDGDNRYAINIKTSEKVIIDGITLTGLRGIGFTDKDNRPNINSSGAYDFTLLNSTITVSQRGIQLWYDSDNPNDYGSKITIENCNFNNPLVTNPNTEVINNYIGGIVFNRTANSTLNVYNTNIVGFDYSITFNYVGNNNNNTVNVENCIFKGRAGLNIMNTFDSIFNIKNTYFLGINIFEGPTEVYGNIVLDNVSNNTLNIEDCTFEVYRKPAIDTNAQGAFFVWNDSSSNTINLIGNNTMVANIYYLSGSEKFPTSSNELCNLINISDTCFDCVVNGRFTSAVCVCTMDNISETFDWNNI